MLMTDTEKFHFENAFKQVVDAVATVLEKPEFDEPRIQNLVMLELIGHVALSMHKGALQQGPEFAEVAATTLINYMAFIAQTMEDGGVDTLPRAEKEMVN